jgi:hypothetical protein
MLSLFLVTDAFDNVSAAIPFIQSLPDKENVVVIALDFWAKKKLRQKGISYKTPDEYLDIGICKDIDVKAIEMARTWYKSLGDRLAYKNIPLGEMAEYDFGYLFIETLRSVELAAKILSCESPDMIFLPQKLRQAELIGSNTMCYQTLPAALHYLAKSGGISVTRLKPGKKAIFRSKMHSLKSRVGFLVLLIIPIVYKMYRCIQFLLKAKGKNVILIAGVPFYRRICTELEKGENACLDIPLMPLPVKARTARRKIKELHNLGEEFAQGGTSHKTLIYNDVPLLEILDYRFQHFFHVQAPALIGAIEWVDKIIRVLKPNILVVMEDVTPVSRVCCRTFKHHGLPVLVIQHGAGSLTNYVGMNGFQIMPLEAQRQAVWGDVYREEWGSKRGKSAESQVVVGNHKYDFVAEGYHPQKSEICHKLGLVPERGIIVVATEWYQGGAATATIEAEEQFIRCTLRALKSFPEEQIVIKLHPGFHKKYRQIVSAIAEEENIQVTITRDYLWELLAVSNLVIISESTVGLDAMVLDKPVVVVNLNGQPDGIAYVSSGTARGAYSPEDIAPVVREVLNNEQVRQELAEARKRFVYEYAYIQDGKACRRVAELIGQMMQKKRVVTLEQGWQGSRPGS